MASATPAAGRARRRSGLRGTPDHTLTASPASRAKKRLQYGRGMMWQKASIFTGRFSCHLVAEAASPLNELRYHY